MKPLPYSLSLVLGETSSVVLEDQFARAERITNHVRLGVLCLLGLGAAAYVPLLPTSLSFVNLAVLAPMLIWSIVQNFAIHARGRRWKPLSFVNAFVDITAVTSLLLGYGLYGLPDQAVKSPIWVAYFVILAARPFTGSPRRAAAVTAVACIEYTALWMFFLLSGRLTLLNNPMETIHMYGTTAIDELAKTLMLLVTGAVSTYATAWNEHTLRKAVEAMSASEARFRAIFEHTGVSIAVLDVSGRIKASNSAFDEFVGYAGQDVSNQPLPSFSPPEDAEHSIAALTEVVADGRSRNTEMRYVRRDGRVVWGSVTLSRTRDAEDDRIIAMIQDVSQRKSLEAELMHQALHDPLTGLANRVLFRDRVEHALARSGRGEAGPAVLFLDLDNFKTVNDTLGHGAGDTLLAHVAKMLLNATRGCDTVARLGGDEFAVLLDGARSDSDILVVAGRIADALGTSTTIDGAFAPSVSASMGIARPSAGEGVDELLRNADVAMYAAKSRARGGFVQYDPAMHAELVDRISLEQDLKDAFRRGEFFLEYQPIVELEGGELRAVETLVRWQHPTRGVVPPDRFIPLAEESGLIVPLGAWILGQACQQAARWNRERGEGRPLGITVNVSGRQIASDQIVIDVARSIGESGLRTNLLTLEITESVLMEDTDLTIRRLGELKALGVLLAVDDFGTGYSSLSHLQQFPVDVLKIDRRFIERVQHDPNSAALARTIIALGSMLSLRTVAEGVENHEQRDTLAELGCELAQGYLFSRPVSPMVVETMLHGPSQLPRQEHAGPGVPPSPEKD
ncbi:MAG: EAL domain-containing protein, partial [Gemmatimonadaceae bacterium]